MEVIMKALRKIVEVEKGNDDNIVWYEDQYFILIAPCYYSFKDIITILKKHNVNQKLRINNILDCVC